MGEAEFNHDRRAFLKATALLTGASVIAGCQRAVYRGEDAPASIVATSSPTSHPTQHPSSTPEPTSPPQIDPTGRVVLVRTDDRAAGIHRALELWDHNTIEGKELFFKPNFNSADPFPGSTDTDTMLVLLEELQRMGAGHITIGDRSGMGNTRVVMQSKDVFKLADELALSTLVFDELAADDWDLWIRHPETSARGRWDCANMLLEDSPLRRPLHAVA
jgi:hypothetical protein